MKKILICDYPSALEHSYETTFDALKKSMGEAFFDYEIEVCAYENDDVLINQLNGVVGLITGFLEIGENILSKATDLKCISVSAVGYGNIDCSAAKAHNVTVCHIEEYCTEEVAEHTIALISALNRNLKYYNNHVEIDKQWKYHTISGGRTLSRQTLGIFGYGRIGRRVAQLAKAFGMKVIVVDPYVGEEAVAGTGVEIISADELFERADVITNHMNLTNDNLHYFRQETFSKMKRHPIFINVGRGGCVKEDDLAKALDDGIIRGAGLDVLDAEEPDLEQCFFTNRDNVILTPHCAFYSNDSIDALQRISGENMGYFLTDKAGKIYSIVKECR